MNPTPTETPEPELKPCHTPEPWHVHRVENKPPKINAANKQGFIAQLGYASEGNRESNAARIVACVNACAGMADPADAIAKARESLERCVGDMLSVTDDEQGGHLFDEESESIIEARAALALLKEAR